MSSPRLIERTLYPPIVEYLKNKGFDTFGEARINKYSSDIVFQLGEHRFVVEIKIENPSPTLGAKAFGQAMKYAKEYDTFNIIIFVYPKLLKNAPILDSKWLTNVALNENIQCHLFTDYWSATLTAKPADIFVELKRLIEKKDRKIDLGSIVKQIQSIVRDLSIISNYINKKEVISEVVNKLDLFTTIGEIKDKRMAENQVTILSSYLLFNQLLFYWIYRKKFDDSGLPELEEIENVQDIQKYFDAITKIDFITIYRTNILGHLPNNLHIISLLNSVIDAIKLLRSELITHDLTGRFFHDLIPTEVRKVLAAFYTHPNSADLLSTLSISSWKNSIIDPSCGSGTLLVSSYRRKMSLYSKIHGFRNLSNIHKKFLEDDITGCDIMPFASHLTTINLAMQNIEQQTNIVRIASMDSLELSSSLIRTGFIKGKGVEITGYEKSTQMTLTGKVAWSKSEGSVSVQGRGERFYLVPSDVVIMNPPFSDREKMPSYMRTHLKNNKILNKNAGGQVNLWGYFIVLSDLLLKPGGKIGVVIPINIARGKATQKIRNFLLNNYTCQFIIKPLEDDAFSEGSFFKDILYVARKKKPGNFDYTGIVSIKKSIKNLDEQETHLLANELLECYENKSTKETSIFEIKFINTVELLNYSENLMPLIGFKTQRNRENLDNFLKLVRSKVKDKLKKISQEIVEEGFHVSPAGLSELVFITKPVSKSRIKRAFLILRKENDNSVDVEIKDSGIIFNLKKSQIKTALRTLTSVAKFNVDKIDFVISQEPPQFDKILQLSKWKGKFDWFKHNQNIKSKSSYVVIGRRFRPNSNNTHHFAFYSRNQIISPDTFKILRLDVNEGVIQTLILNSSITIANIISLREQTTGGFTDIRESELTSFDIFDLKKLSQSQIQELQNLYEKLSNIDFPSIKEQYITDNQYRRLLDTKLLEIIGFKLQEINSILDGLYRSIAEELNTKG